MNIEVCFRNSMMKLINVATLMETGKFSVVGI